MTAIITGVQLRTLTLGNSTTAGTTPIALPQTTSTTIFTAVSYTHLTLPTNREV